MSSHVLPVSGVLPLHPSTRAAVVVSQLGRCVDWVKVGASTAQQASSKWQELCVAVWCMYQQVEGFLAVFSADPRLVCWGVARVAGCASPAQRL